MKLRGAVILFSGFTQHADQHHGTALLHDRARHSFAGADVAVELRPWDDREIEATARYYRDALKADGILALYGYSRGWEAIVRFCAAVGRRVAWVGANDPCPVQGFGIANGLNWISGGRWFDVLNRPGNVGSADAWRQVQDRPRGRLVISEAIKVHQHPTETVGHAKMDDLVVIHATVLTRLEALLRSAR